jgi:hypothetical protein
MVVLRANCVVALIVHSAVSNPTPKVLEILSRRESDIYVCELIDETLTFDDVIG